MFPIRFDKAMEMVEQGLDVRVRRQNILASNIANKDTPGYKARDLDFRAVLEAAEQGSEGTLYRTDERHIPTASQASEPRISEKQSQGKLDGNNVEMTEEMKNLVENTLTYDALIRCAGKKIQLLKTAIQGG